jgi:hypothetical protein
MYSDEHARHNTCATPGCASFHLFCPTCGGRHHLEDEFQSAQLTYFAADSFAADSFAADSFAAGSFPTEPFPTVARNTVPDPASVTARPAATNTA